MIRDVRINKNNVLKMNEEIRKLEEKYAEEYDDWEYEEPQSAVILAFEEAKARIEKQKQQETRANIQNIQEEQVINKEKNSLSVNRTAESKTSVNQARRKPSPKSRRKKKKIKFKTMTGIIIAAAVVSTGVGVAVGRSSRDDNTVTTDDTYVVDNTIYANTTDLNDFNLVIVNDGVNDYFLDSFTSNLTSKGIEFQVANGSDSLTGVNGSEVFIGLLPYDNPGMTRVIAQYEEKDNQSDVMAVALRNSLLKNDLTSDTIQCGVWRYDESAEKHLVESPLEHKVTYSSNRFVSVEVNDSVDVNKFTSSFVEGMLRYKNYVENSSDFDLFTRVKGGDTLEAIASAHNTSSATLANINGLPSPDNVGYNTTLMFPASSDILYNRELVIDDVNTKGKTH
ncbi:MAG: LysM peptidoglycan-binding domain-containing protein [bacterium]|nr:LysM peptidoglycan-binding domain-containing protein [bacterium]